MFDVFKKISAALLNFIIHPIYTLGCVVASPFAGLAVGIGQAAGGNYRGVGLTYNGRSPSDFIHFVATLTYIISSIATNFYYSLINFFTSPVVAIAHGITQDFTDYGTLYANTFVNALDEANAAGYHAANTITRSLHRVFGYPENSTLGTYFTDLERNAPATQQSEPSRNEADEPSVRLFSRFGQTTLPSRFSQALGIDDLEETDAAINRFLSHNARALNEEYDDYLATYPLKVLAATLNFFIYPIFTLFSIVLSPFTAFVSSTIASVRMILMGEDESYQLQFGESSGTNGFIRAVCSMTYILSSVATSIYYNLINFFTSPVVGIGHGMTYGFNDYGSLYGDTYDQTANETADAAYHAANTMQSWLKKVFGYTDTTLGRAPVVIGFGECPRNYPSARHTTSEEGTNAPEVVSSPATLFNGINTANRSTTTPQDNRATIHSGQVPSGVAAGILGLMLAGGGLRRANNMQGDVNDMLLQLVQQLSEQQPRMQPVGQSEQQALIAPVENTAATRAVWAEALRGEGAEAPQCPIILEVPDVDDAALLQKQYRNNQGQWQPVPARTHLFSYQGLRQQINTNNVHPMNRDPINNPGPETIDGVSYRGVDVRYQIIRLSPEDTAAVDRIAVLRGVDSNHTLG